MKQFAKYIFLAILFCSMALTGQSRTFRIDISKMQDDLPMELRKFCEKITYADTIFLNFGKGTYRIDATVECKCHVILRGDSRENTKIVFAHGRNRNNLKAYASDAFFKFDGTPAHPISVSISDIAFDIEQHEGILWKEAERYAVKIYHANRVDVHDVTSYLENAKITNFDLRVCSNVSFTNNEITNFNNCETGGCLWLRGEMHNVIISGNTFRKYGKDEAVAIFDNVIDSSNSHTRGAASRTNINIEDNVFYYGGYTGKDKDPSAVPGMIVSLLTNDQENSPECTTADFHLRNNKFQIDDAVQRCIYIGFSPKDKHKDIYIENNQIINNDIGRKWNYSHDDITVQDMSAALDTIHISRNSIINRNLVIKSDGGNGYVFLHHYGGNVTLTGNKIVDEMTVNPETGKPAGVQLIYCGAKNGSVTMDGNVFKGVSRLAFLSTSKRVNTFTINAANNYFSGDPHIYCDNIQQVHLFFSRNTLVCNNSGFFLRNFPDDGSITFNNNDVTVTPGNGTFMIKWGKGSDNRMRFKRIEISGNVFHGVNSEKELLKNIKNVCKRKLKRNTYFSK